MACSLNIYPGCVGISPGALGFHQVLLDAVSSMQVFSPGAPSVYQSSCLVHAKHRFVELTVLTIPLSDKLQWHEPNKQHEGAQAEKHPVSNLQRRLQKRRRQAQEE